MEEDSGLHVLKIPLREKKNKKVSKSSISGSSDSEAVLSDVDSQFTESGSSGFPSNSNSDVGKYKFYC